ncbi:hypothetical protein SLE2022_074700 [Rubroshorea leprosula]
MINRIALTEPAELAVMMMSKWDCREPHDMFNMVEDTELITIYLVSEGVLECWAVGLEYCCSSTNLSIIFRLFLIGL